MVEKNSSKIFTLLLFQMNPYRINYKAMNETKAAIAKELGYEDYNQIQTAFISPKEIAMYVPQNQLQSHQYLCAKLHY